MQVKAVAPLTEKCQQEDILVGVELFGSENNNDSSSAWRWGSGVDEVYQVVVAAFEHDTSEKERESGCL